MIILTCSVEPSDKVRVLRNQTQVRLEDYVQSISKWIRAAEQTNSKLLILENSGNLLAIKNRLGTPITKHVYFLQTTKDETSEKQGISAGEFAMLREAIPFITNLPGIEFCWKVTGRLFVENFDKLNSLKKKHTQVNRFYNPMHLVDTRFIGFPIREFCEIFSKNPKFAMNQVSLLSNSKFDTFSSIEEFITLQLTTLECKGVRVGTMKKIPIYSGSSASTDKKLNSKSVVLKLKILNLIRPIALKMLGGSAP